MHLVYMDDSKGDGLVVFSALLIPVDSWQAALDHFVGMRQQMKLSDGVYARHELHATDWIAGRGHVAPHVVPKAARWRLFEYVLSSIAMAPGIQIINACGPDAHEFQLFERLLNRIERNMLNKSSKAILISDDGKSYDKLLRRMRRFNYIPSRFGSWADGNTSKNIPVQRIVEDIVYKDSSKSYFIQAADFCAFSLLRNEKPSPRMIQAGLVDSFHILDRVLVKRAFGADHRKLGIIRV